MNSTRKNTLLIIIALMGFSLMACSKGPLSIYKHDIRQGSYVTQQMTDRLAVNLTKQQVQAIMGTPTAIPVLHQNRWDYFYSLESTDTSKVTKRALSLYFDKNGRLAYYKGDWNIKGLPRKN